MLPTSEVPTVYDVEKRIILNWNNFQCHGVRSKIHEQKLFISVSPLYTLAAVSSHTGPGLALPISRFLLLHNGLTAIWDSHVSLYPRLHLLRLPLPLLFLLMSNFSSIILQDRNNIYLFLGFLSQITLSLWCLCSRFTCKAATVH
jgi:hypothetical protein